MVKYSYLINFNNHFADLTNQSGEIDVPTTASLLQVIEQNKSKKTTPQKDVSTSSEHGKGGGKAKNSRDKEDDPETKQVVEKLLAAKEEIARRHAETIGIKYKYYKKLLI